MRMRKKPNLIPRMEKCAAVQIKEPKALKGEWKTAFPDKTLWLELGCGKGRFTLGTAQENPDVMLLAVEKVADAMVIGMERVCAAEVRNIRFIEMDALELREVFEKGEVERLFINFCDPWPKSRDAKHRLTAPGFLRIYAELLDVGGEIHFKTDNRPLFDWSLEQFSAEGWELRELFKKGEVARLFINFCDPWPKSRDAKHRLTAPGFLRSYADLLNVGGEIHFKTDNRPLFDWSLEQFTAEGWELREVTTDLHANGVCGVMTDYEAKFHAEGVPINRLVAVRCEATKDGKAGEVARLRNSALADARGAITEE